MPTNQEFTGGAKATTLNGAINSAATAIVLTDGTGYPTGSASRKFVLSIGTENTASFEKVLCDSRSGNNVTINASGRGYDGTTATSHASGEAINHVWNAVAATDANDHVNNNIHPTGPATTVTTQAAGDAGTVGTSTLYARQDHKHGEPAADAVAATASFRTLGTGATQAAAGNHTHAATLVPSQTYIATSETTTSTSYADLATVGPAVTVTVGSSGRVMVITRADISNSLAASPTFMSYAVSGASTAAASDDFALRSNGEEFAASLVTIETGFTPGSTTFTAKYRVVAGTGTFLRRSLIVIPL